MKLIRAKNPSVVDLLAPHFIEPEDGASRDQFADNLRRVLREKPAQTCVCLALGGEKEDELLCFAIAYCENLHEEGSSAYLYQVWLSDATNVDIQNIADKLFLRITLWSEQVNASNVYTNDQGVSHALLARWKFTQYSTSFKFSVTETLEAAFLNNLNKEELDNERMGVSINRSSGSGSKLPQQGQGREAEVGSDVELRSTES